MFPTKGVSDSTLTGRQWAIAPRVGARVESQAFNNKLVVRAGCGMYYDRGELFSYLLPGVAAGVHHSAVLSVTNQTLPFVNCARSGSSNRFVYEGFTPRATLLHHTVRLVQQSVKRTSRSCAELARPPHPSLPSTTGLRQESPSKTIRRAQLAFDGATTTAKQTSA